MGLGDRVPEAAMTRHYSTTQRLQNIAVIALVAFAALLAISVLILLSHAPDTL